MAFSIYKSAYNGAAPLEYLPCGAITPKLGAALKLTAGKLALCGATDKPEYICARTAETAVADGAIIPAQKIRADDTLMVTDCPTMTAVNIGDKVTLSSGALTVTATKENGVVAVIEKDDVNGVCIVRI